MVLLVLQELREILGYLASQVNLEFQVKYFINSLVHYISTLFDILDKNIFFKEFIYCITNFTTLLVWQARKENQFTYMAKDFLVPWDLKVALVNLEAQVICE